MKFQRVKCRSLSFAKEIFVSNSYIITCTGKKANILDKQFNLLQTIEGLDYVYSAEMSPDEKELLLVSNENIFYVVNLETGFKRKVLVKTPYNYNIEGNGCWSFDGKYIYIAVMNSKNILSTLRRYDADNLEIFKDYIVEKYFLHKIFKNYNDKTYLLQGFSRNDEMTHILFFDGEDYRDFLLEDTKNNVICNVELKKDYLLAYMGAECRIYSLEGKLLGNLNHPNPTYKKISFSMVFDFPKVVENFPDKLSGLCEKLGLDNFKVDDGITKIADSKNGEFKYISSNSGFYVIDKKTGNCVIEHQEDYGVQNFLEIEDGLIAINAFCNVKLYRLSREE